MLTDKQKRFVLEYIQDCNATQAAIRAGYSKSTARCIGQQNLDKPEIKKAIQDKLDEIESSKIASAKEIMEFWTSVMRGEVREQTLMYVERGIQEIVEIDSNTNARIKASENLAKVNGMFNEKAVKTEESELSKLDELIRGISEVAKS